MDQSKIFALLKAYAEYFPVGLPGYRNQFPGYAEAMAIIDRKVNGLVSGERNAWTEWIESMKQMYGESVMDFSHIQYPSLKMLFKLDGQELDGLKVERNFVVLLSLLVPYYTLHYQDTVIKSGNPSSRIASFFYLECNTGTEKHRDIVDTCKKSLENLFPNYSCIDHYTLCGVKIEGAFPLVGDIGDFSGQYSLYELFMDGLDTLEHVQVMK